MNLHDLFEATIKAELPKNKTSVEPWRMTYKEYYAIANPSRKMHDSGAYDFSVKDLNKDYQKEDLAEMKLLRSISLKGIQVDIFGHAKDKRKAKYHNTSQEQIDARFGDAPYEYSLKAVDHESGNIIGTAQDEWGALLISVAKEYRGLGIGPLLGEIMRKYVPDYDSGGFTYAGRDNFMKLYAAFVAEALRAGKYSQAVKNGEMTADRAKEIIASANLKAARHSFEPSKEWAKDKMVIGNFHDTIVIYDSRLVELFAKGKHENYLSDKFLYGVAYIGVNPGEKDVMYAFGGQNDRIKNILMTIVLSMHHQSAPKNPVYMDKDQFQYDQHKRQPSDRQPRAGAQGPPSRRLDVPAPASGRQPQPEHQ